jgi:hypothetical protein
MMAVYLRGIVGSTMHIWRVPGPHPASFKRVVRQVYASMTCSARTFQLPLS